MDRVEHEDSGDGHTLAVLLTLTELGALGWSDPRFKLDPGYINMVDPECAQVRDSEDLS